jgi:hypothetical protein
MSTPAPGRRLLGRRRERAALELLVSAVRAGESQALVAREAGVGKWAVNLIQHERPCRSPRRSGWLHRSL